MRDPIFYPFHADVNDIFLQFKATIPRYTVAQVKIELMQFWFILFILLYFILARL